MTAFWAGAVIHASTWFTLILTRAHKRQAACNEFTKLVPNVPVSLDVCRATLSLSRSFDNYIVLGIKDRRNG
jgi:hypothetical protein